MKDYTFNFEIVTLTTQFADAFNDVVIKRYNQYRETNGQEFDVTFLYAPKQRVIHDLNNKQNNLKLPIISYNITSFSRDSNRVFNKLQGAEISNNSKYDRIRQPVPVNLGISLNVMTKFQLDMDQIISNFVPYCDPYVVISWPDPYAGQEIRTIIEWDGNVSINYPIDQQSTTPFSRIEANANFNIRGWIFKNQQASIGKIHNIYANFFGVQDIYNSYTAMKQATSEDFTDFTILSGRPVLREAYPYSFQTVSNNTVTVNGNMFEKTSLYFLQGPERLIGPSTVYNFTTAEYMSAYADYITGVQIFPDIASDNTLSFNLEISANRGGLIDLIAINDAGISYLSQDSERKVACPYPLSGDCLDWSPWQPATVGKGVYVSPYQGVGFMIIGDDFTIKE